MAANDSPAVLVHAWSLRRDVHFDDKIIGSKVEVGDCRKGSGVASCLLEQW